MTIRAHCFAVALAATFAASPSAGEATIGFDPPAIARAQLLLEHFGYEPGMIDGKAGPALAAAVSAYQRDNGLAITGRLDLALMNRLLADLEAEPSKSLIATPPTRGFWQRYAWPSRMGGW